MGYVYTFAEAHSPQLFVVLREESTTNTTATTTIQDLCCCRGQYIEEKKGKDMFWNFTQRGRDPSINLNLRQDRMMFFLLFTSRNKWYVLKNCRRQASKRARVSFAIVVFFEEKRLKQSETSLQPFSNLTQLPNEQPLWLSFLLFFFFSLFYIHTLYIHTYKCKRELFCCCCLWPSGGVVKLAKKQSDHYSIIIASILVPIAPIVFGVAAAPL